MQVIDLKIYIGGLIMGDISIIARRKKDGSVEYGWSGNGGYYSTMGPLLLDKYSDEAMVDYLFGLGQLAHLGEPYSERERGGYNFLFSTKCTGEPHYKGRTERDIFSRIAFIDYGYFYDTDNKWYYIEPGVIKMKLPLELIRNNLDNGDSEYDFLSKLDHDTFELIFGDYYNGHEEFRDYLKGMDITKDKLGEIMTECGGSLYGLYEQYNSILKYFDDWALVKADQDNTDVKEIILKPRTDKHIETIEW